MSILFIIASFVLFLWVERRSVYRLFGSSRRRHKRKIKQSETLYLKLRTFEPPQLIAYLRKIDPYVFEELILTALKTQGYKIRRNTSYSADGGSDGMVYINKRRYLIQAKRYSGAINAKHVHEFVALLSKRKNVAGGLFVHTGKTPVAIKELLCNYPPIHLISGQTLVDLILGLNVEISIK